jgi:hypothetical protein|nr:MAG TPA: Transactivation domain 2 [Caudoviricetes sp.]
MDMIELIAPEGFAYVNRSHRLIGYYLYCPDQAAADLWALTPEDEALSLEAQWISEDEAKAKAKAEAEAGEAQP